MCSEQMNILITGHLDGTNTPKQEAILDEHLHKCAECRRLLNEYESIDAELSKFTVAPPAGFTASVMHAISQEAPLPKKAKKHTFRYGTMIAAAAAVLVLAVSAGRITMPKGSSVAIYPTEADATPTEAAVEESEIILEDREALPEEPQAVNRAETEIKSASGASQHFPANVDCAALANTEGCYVGLLYEDSIPEALKDAPSTPLSDGTMYTVSLDILNELKEQYSVLQIYSPENIVPDESKNAYLILATDPA